MHLGGSTIRDAAIGMGERGLTLAEFFVELVVRVDNEGLLESLEGLALGLEYFHDGSECNRWFGRKGLPISVCLSVHASYLVNDVRSTCHAALRLAKCTRILSEPSRCVDNPLEEECGYEEVASYALHLRAFLLVYGVFFPSWVCPGCKQQNPGPCFSPTQHPAHPCNAAGATRRDQASQVKAV